MRIQTFLSHEQYIKFKRKMEETNQTPYALAQTLIVKALNTNGKQKPLSDYSTRELLEEIWNRIP